MESHASVEGSVVAAIAATCQIDPTDVHADAMLDDLGLGSMGIVAVISRLEALYQIELKSDQVISLLQTGLVGEFMATAREIIESMTNSLHRETLRVPDC